ncbi:MAG: T9SS type A sorting domain-containing protein [Bacteroidetes bacterium]|nr:T9SS type A sorting domain-containing protein [Bacteroidota bacterium]
MAILFGKIILDENNLGGPETYDFWIVTMHAECIPFIEICNTVDDDCNGLIDEGITDSITITATGATTICQGESVTLNATYSGTTVQWKRNGAAITGATSATYITTQKGLYTCYTESDCASAESAGINVVVNKKPSAAITPAGPTSFCAGGNVTLNVTPVGGCSYQWYKGASLIAGATGLSYIASTPGNYKCQVTKIATGCFKNSNTIAVFVPCKEGEELFTSNWTIAPNPATNQIIINNLSDISNEINTINILNSLGEIVITETVENNQQMIIDISKLPKGLYFVKLNGEKTLQSFIKQ